MYVITHRGLDFEHHHSFTESSREAFQFFLNAGLGIEFDVQITLDGIPVISHDTSLTRIAGSEHPLIKDISAKSFLETKLPNGNTLTLDELVNMMIATQGKTMSVHALHLKYENQTPEQLDVLLPYLEKLVDLPLLIFDIIPSIGTKIKNHFPTLQLAASIAHPHDISRYNSAVGGTLLSMEELAQYRDIYEWAWLDEWDRTDEDGNEKALYTATTFSTLHELDIKSVVVSPELHATSPKLLGGESHPDAESLERLEKRWRTIFSLQPNAICTDYPKKVTGLQHGK